MDSLKHFRKRSSNNLPRDELANSARATFRPRSRKALDRAVAEAVREPRRTPGVDLRVAFLDATRRWRSTSIFTQTSTG